MHKTLKRTLGVFLSAVMICTMIFALPVTASADTVNGTIGSITWTIDDSNVLTVTGTGDMPDFTYGEAPWLYDSSTQSDLSRRINKIVIGNGITSVGDYSFYDCEYVSSVELPDTIGGIGEHAFQYCYRLNDIELPEGVQTIGSFAFYHCGSESAVPGHLTIPSTVTLINESAFSYTHFRYIIMKSDPDLAEDAFLFSGVDYGAYTRSNGTLAVPKEPISVCGEYKSTCTLSYDANGDTCEVPASVTHESGAFEVSVTAPTPDASERSFVGWSLTDGMTYFIIYPGDTIYLGSDLTLYAVWEDTIRFTDDGSIVYEDKYVLNTLPDVFYDYYNAEYTFSGLSYSGLPVESNGSTVLGGYYSADGKRLFAKQDNCDDIAELYYKDYYTAPGDPEDYAEERKAVAKARLKAAEALSQATDSNGVIELQARWVGLPEITGYSISLGGDITINFGVHFPDGLSPDDYSTITAYVYGDNYYDSSYTSGLRLDLHDKNNYSYSDELGHYLIHARLVTKEMTDNMYAVIECNCEECSTSPECSVKSYADSIISGDHDELFAISYGYSAEKIAALKTLCKSMLNVGARAQEYFGYNTSSLADDGLDYTIEDYDFASFTDPDNSATGSKFQVSPCFAKDTSVYVVNTGNWDGITIDFNSYYYDSRGNYLSEDYYNRPLVKTARKINGFDLYRYDFPDDNREYTLDSVKNDTGTIEISCYANAGCIITPEYDEDYGWTTSYESIVNNNRYQFVNTQGWQKVYIWDVGGEAPFPGKQMTYVSNRPSDNMPIYSIDVSDMDHCQDDYGRFVFSDGTSQTRTVPVNYLPIWYTSESVTPTWEALPKDDLAYLNVTYEGSSIGLHNTISYGIFLRVDQSTENLKVTCNGKELNAFILNDSNAEYSSEYIGYHFYRIYDISPADLAGNIELTITASNVTDPVSGTVLNGVSSTLIVSPVSYMKKAMQLEGERHEELRQLIPALYDFGRKAAAFENTL